ncbi:MAG TPA: hypothetical protein ENK86_06305 [Campylobacterales bacterium]|nr:hypothetical protein [Campylobacterales bacterium]
MLNREIKEFKQIKEKARSYLCYLISSSISNSMSGGSFEDALDKIELLKHAIPKCEVIYVMNAEGIQITKSISNRPELDGQNLGKDRSNRSYYYNTIKEHRCELSDPYPSLTTKKFVVTASFPIYDQEGTLLAIVCVEVGLQNLLRMIHPTSVDSIFGNMSKMIYAAFSVALFFVALLLFVKGINSFMAHGIAFQKVDINEMFQSTILLTLSLAIVDLVKAIFEEEVLGKERKTGSADTHQTMVRFLGSIIIALSIEALMLVFKFALNDPSQLLYAVYLLIGVTALIIGLSFYLKITREQMNKH